MDAIDMLVAAGYRDDGGILRYVPSDHLPAGRIAEHSSETGIDAGIGFEVRDAGSDGPVTRATTAFAARMPGLQFETSDHRDLVALLIGERNDVLAAVGDFPAEDVFVHDGTCIHNAFRGNQWADYEVASRPPGGGALVLAHPSAAFGEEYAAWIAARCAALSASPAPSA